MPAAIGKAATDCVPEHVQAAAGRGVDKVGNDLKCNYQGFRLAYYSTLPSRDKISSPAIRGHGAASDWPPKPDSLSVTDFPQFDYTMRDVRRAGEALATNLIWNDESAEDIRQVFRIANNFRDSHAYPMNRIRAQLSGQIRKSRIAGVAVARLKRMPSIRRKLKAISTNLNQIQDLAGCRAVVPSMDDVNTITAAMRENSSHVLHREYNYMIEPKQDGYRSHHMVFKFQGEADAAVFNDRRVEVQVRTQLQHSWATAVEAVGLFRHEDMKAGQGSPEWLKLFKLMSMEFLLAERCGNVDGSHKERLAEITALNKQLDAVQVLEDLRQAVRITDNYVWDAKNKPDYFLIQYDRKSNAVKVTPQFGPIFAVQSYDKAESIESVATNGGVNTVLVEVDEVESLKAAYPNYFGDVDLFKNRLIVATGGDPTQFELEPQKTAPIKPRVKPDYSWLHSFKRWK